MRRRTLPADLEDDRGVEWLVDAGTFRAALAQIRAMPQPFTGGITEVREIQRRQKARAQEWCEARGLDYHATRSTVLREINQREKP